MKQLPQDIEAEMAALGSIFIDPSTLDDVKDAIHSPEDFFLHKNATIFKAMCDLVDQGNRLDMVTLTGWLGDRGLLSSIDGGEYLFKLSECVPHSSGARHYAERVAEKALRRRLIAQEEAVLSSLYEGSTDAADLIDSSVNRLIDMKPRDNVDSAPIDYWLDRAMEDDRPCINSGLRTLDDIVEGFEAGSYVVIGARPSMGKTAMGVTLALSMAKSGVKVGFISAEMSGKRVGRRFVCAEARISTKEFNRNKHEDEIQEVIEGQKGLPLFINQTPGAHINKVCSQIRRWKRENDIEVAFVDYLQILATGIEKEYDAVTDASRKLNALKGELDITIFALAQLNRANTQRTDKRPSMADLRGSGAVEQDADVILMPHREAYYASGNAVMEGNVNDTEAEILVEKSRDGRTGVAPVGWIGKCGVFTSGALSAF